MNGVKKSFGSGACFGLAVLVLSACAGSQAPVAGDRAAGRAEAMALDMSLALKMARDMRRAGHPDEAISLLRSAVSHATPDPGVFVELGRLEIAAGRPQEAEVVLTEALRLSPEHADASHLMAVALDRQDRPEDARHYYDRALALEPGNAKILNNLGLSRALAGDHAGALDVLERAAALSPGSAQIAANLRLVETTGLAAGRPGGDE